VQRLLHMRAYAVRYEREDLSNEELPAVAQVPEGTSRRKAMSRTLQLCTRDSCKLARHAPLDAMPGMTEVRVQDPFPYKQKGQGASRMVPDETDHDAVVEWRLFDSH